MIDLDDPALGVTREEVEQEWKRGTGGKAQIARRFKLRNLRVAIATAPDFLTLQKAMLRLADFVT